VAPAYFAFQAKYVLRLMPCRRRIVVDNGPEFAGRALGAWAYRRGITLAFQPSKPTPNAYIDSFCGDQSLVARTMSVSGPLLAQFNV